MHTNTSTQQQRKTPRQTHTQRERRQLRGTKQTFRVEIGGDMPAYLKVLPMSLKITVVGDGAVGKTSTVVRWMQGSFPDKYGPTVAGPSTFLLPCWVSPHSFVSTENGSVEVWVERSGYFQVSLWDTAVRLCLALSINLSISLSLCGSKHCFYFPVCVFLWSLCLSFSLHHNSHTFVPGRWYGYASAFYRN